MLSMRIEGGDKLARELRALPNRVNLSVQRDALTVGGEIIRSAAASMAPRAPGSPDLADHIGMSAARPDDGSVGLAIGPTRGFFYGYFQEFGTSRHGAQPFMRPAYDSSTDRSLKVITAALWSALIRRGASSARGSGVGVGL